MPVYSPCTWNMTAAQLVTPTSSQLAAINAIQAMITSSTYWTVNSTGTTTAGYKYVEARPTNTSSVYKDYRVLFVERVNNTTNKTYLGSTSPFNTTTNIFAYFAPDGGSSWCTFTPANIETGNRPYVGTRYGASNNTLAMWGAIPSAWTAFWMYECDGQMWIVSRQSASAHYYLQIGAGIVSPVAGVTDYNEGGTETSLPIFMSRTSSAVTSTAINALYSGSSYIYWYHTAPTTKTAVQLSGPSQPMSNPSASGQSAFYNTSKAAAIFMPINIGSSTDIWLLRGQFYGTQMQTRTTVKDAAGVNILGYSWYPDDTLVASTAFNLMFMNTP